ncbi:Protein POLLENLESS 3 [Linum grandiflorum]
MRLPNDDGEKLPVVNCVRRFQVRGFLTPPPTWTPPHSRPDHRRHLFPFSERKMSSSSTAGGACKTDLFHVIHKVPAGDSPYVKAKHLIEKDPSRAVSMFWAAINAGDRVDSALKDMAVVLKQLNRSDEAIEAIKSFRHLCVPESQESIDNVLVELYKRSGRVEEEIEMLQRKLKNIEEGMVFGGRKTKVARSQGKKIQITIEQEKARILGNLAWAYLQQHNYGLAEQHYRKALSLEADKNKQCNLAVCLIHMNKVAEARALLQAVRASCGNKPMDESYAKSFERAYQMLTDSERGTTTSPYIASSPVGSFGNCNTVPRRQIFAATSPMPVLFSQPRRCLFMSEGGSFNHTPQLRSQPRFASAASPSDGDWRKPWTTQTSEILLKLPVKEIDDSKGSSEAASVDQVCNKSWADMVEEEEELEKQVLGWMIDDEGEKGGSLDENRDSNVLKSTAARKLCFDGGVAGKKMIRNRLQVFKDITPAM